MVRRTTTTTATATTTATTASATTATPIIKRKKGRPSLIDLQNRALLLQQQQQQKQQNPNNSNSQLLNNNHRSRSTRRIPNLPAHFLDGSDSDDYDDHDDRDHINSDDNDDDDDDERAEKKIKLVVQFPNNHKISQKHKNNNKDNKKGSKATDNNENGTTRKLGGLEHGPTTTTTAITSSTGNNARLPDKKLLLLILDKLQKKDTRGVFAEPVDPEELPDYHEIIEHPMDFETVRKKLLGGAYTILDQLEDDVNLICSNAMQYNAPSTIFFRQARAIQELAKKEFEVLRQDGGVIELPNKPRRGRPPGSKNWKKLLKSSPPERVVTVHESSSEPTPASREEDRTKSGSYNLRKGSSLYRFPRSLDYDFDYSGISASPFKSMSYKYGKKTCGSDESKRDTYFLPSESNSARDPLSSPIFEGFDRQLTEQVGLGLDHSYSRSLARFGADLGSTVWKMVSQKIRSVLPPGVEFGPGWVGDPKMSSKHSNSLVSQNSFKNDTSTFPGANFAFKSLTSCTEKPLTSPDFSPNFERPSLKACNDNRVSGPRSSLQIQRPNSFGSGIQFQEEMARPMSSPSSSLLNNPYALDSSSSFDASRNFHGMMSSESDLVTQGQGMPYWQNLSIQEGWDHPYPVDLSRVFQASSSKNSNLPIGSPPQLDLVLQL